MTSSLDRPARGHEAAALVVGVAGALWRCRLELALVAVLVGAQLALATLVGSAIAAALMIVLVAAVLSVPRVRGVLVRSLRAAHIRRAWWRAWTDCGLPRVRAGRVSAIPAGELVRVRASRGSSLEFVEARAEELAVCLQVREVRVARDPDNAATGTVTLVRRDPLAGGARSRGRNRRPRSCRCGSRSRSASTSWAPRSR